MSPTQLLLVAPVVFWLGFELAQLIVAERYLGLRQIERGVDPRTLPLNPALAAGWGVAIVVYWAWMALMISQPLGRTQVLLMITVSLAGFSLRRSSPMKWILVILTFEGALRIGMLLSLLGLAWNRL